MPNSNLQTLSKEVHNELTTNILPFWATQMTDAENGGFYGRMDGKGTVYPEADKGCVLNARILWTFSSAYRILKNPSYLIIASRAKDYILNYFIDKEYGGAYWMLDYKGGIADGKKQIYAQAFVIYALVEYYRATDDKECLKIAIHIYNLIEKYSFDPVKDGYLEAFNRVWGEIGDLRLSTKDANEKKTMNTHLHVLEAYTNLFRVWKDDNLKSKLKGLIHIFIHHIVNGKSFHLNMFFDENWNDKTDLISYGHDIESSWLLYEAALVLEDNALMQKVKEMTPKIANAATEGLQPDGSLIYETFFKDGHIDTDRHWWVNAEAVVGYLNAYQITLQDAYLNKSMKSWNFIKNHIIDKTNGEWFWSVNNNLKPNTKDDKAGFWKCPYHNARMCLEIIERAESMDKK
jgi:mannobiose 2-epimerase